MTDELTPQQEKQFVRIKEQVNGVVSGLTLMQRTFLIWYLLLFNATKAAEKAGYAHPDKQGPRLARHEKIKAAIDDYFRQQEMSAREVIARLSAQARAEYADYLKAALDGEGRADVGVDVQAMLDDGKGHLIKGISYSRDGRLIVQFHDAQAALVQVGRYHKLFTDGLDVKSGDEAVPFADIVAAMQKARKVRTESGGSDG